MDCSGRSFSIYKDGYKFIQIGLGATLVFAFFSAVLAWLFLALTLFCVFFFRNPKRAIPSAQSLIVNPADGVVCAIVLESPPSELNIGDEQRYRVSTFLGVLDVHVNRMPVSGRIKEIIYKPGSFLNAALDKASVFNEKNTIVVEITNKKSKSLIAFSQIAGMVARRIVCDAHEGQDVNKGEVFGMIRFGSRCDLWLPPRCSPQVIVGQTMVAGETVVGDLLVVDSPARDGSIV